MDVVSGMLYVVVDMLINLICYFCVRDSKKDPALRSDELRSVVCPAMIKYVATNCHQLMKDVETQPIVTSTIKNSSGKSNHILHDFQHPYRWKFCHDIPQ